MQGVKYVLCLVSLLAGGLTVSAQNAPEPAVGEVSYKSSQTIYIRFASTRDIAIGDTLYFADRDSMTAILVVKNKSSTSCTGTQLTDHVIEIGTKMMTRTVQVPEEEVAETPPIPVPVLPEEPTDIEDPSEHESSKSTDKNISSLSGRISAAAYINFAENSLGNKQRMRYTISVNAKRINQSKFSAETYMSFRHTLDEWDEVQQNFKRAFRVYGLAVQYEPNNTTSLWAGRRINYNISNIGAIDGLQAEKQWNKIMVGAFAGSRPDVRDYDFNPNLRQYGVYVGNQTQAKNGWVNSSLAFVEQKNNGHTDRRFLYVQHQNALIKRMHIFTSFEFDLYTIQNGQPKNTFDITSLYVSIRYRPTRTLSLFGAYDARNNIIYYETYKSTIDQLLEDETRQGYRLSLNFRPWKRVTIGSNAGYRFQKDSPSSKNLNSYIRFSNVPGIKASVSLTVVLLESAYLNGTVIGGRISRDLIRGKLSGQLDIRAVQYRYNNVEVPLNQSIIGLNLSYRLTRKLSFALNFEGEFQKKLTSGRVYTNLIKRL